MSIEIPSNIIGEKLKHIRMMRQASLDDVAVMTGVSKPMLGQIERGLSVPTITTLWKIATGLKIPLSSFLDSPKSTYQIANKDDKTIIEEENGAMRAYLLFPYDPIRSVEVFFIEFDEGCCHHSDCHNEGVEEYILIVSGSITMTLNDETITITEGQSLRFNANIPHCYHNNTQEKCSIYNIIFYSK